MQRCKIVIEIDPLSEPISGTAGDGLGEPNAFVGYMRLVATIEQLLAAARSTDPVIDAKQSRGSR
jgi:hypothetical protein